MNTEIINAAAETATTPNIEGGIQMNKVTYLNIVAIPKKDEIKLYVNKETCEFQDADMAEVVYNNKVDELCPVYLQYADGRVIFNDAHNLLPLCQWLEDKKSLVDMMTWRETFKLVPYMRNILAAIEKLDVEIAKYVPQAEEEEKEHAHCYGFPEMAPVPVQKNVYEQYAVRYQRYPNEQPRTAYYADRLEACAVYSKIVSLKLPVVALGYTGTAWIKLAEANK